MAIFELRLQSASSWFIRFHMLRASGDKDRELDGPLERKVEAVLPLDSILVWRGGIRGL